MRIQSLTFVFGLVSFGCGSCGSGARQTPARASSDATSAPVATAAASGGALCKAPPEGTSGMVLPALAPSSELKLDGDRPGGVEPDDWKGKLTVDGVVTASMWPMQPPSQWKLADGRTLLYDGYNAQLLMIWEPKTKTLTELGRGMLTPVPGVGLLLYTSEDDSGQVGIFSVIDPAAPRLRELWRFDRATSDVAVVGVVDGMPALIVKPPMYRKTAFSGTSMVEESKPVTFLCLSGAGVTGRFDAVLPDGFHAVGVDPVDGHRLLLLADPDYETLDAPGRGFPGFDGTTPSFDAEVAVLDLVSGKVRSLGRAVGGYTQATNVPHPVLEVAWSDGTIDVTKPLRAYALPDGMVTLVDPQTERLVLTAP
jgi:hypothetical protein